jgi:hypothetical protein
MFFTVYGRAYLTIGDRYKVPEAQSSWLKVTLWKCPAAATIASSTLALRPPPPFSFTKRRDRLLLLPLEPSDVER